MGEQRKTPSDADLAAAVERNGFAQLAAFAAWARADVHDGTDMLRVLSDVPDAAFNMVVRAELTDHDADAAIASVQAAARARGVPLAWLVGPASKPADLGARLTRHGFRREEDGLAMTLRLRGYEPERVAPGLTVDEVVAGRSLSAWARIVTAGFALPSWAEEPLRAMTEDVLRGYAPRFRAFLVRRAGVPVAAASLFVEDGVAGIYNVATLGRERGRGAGTAATLAALRAAQRAGCDLAVLQATLAAAALYGRLGFRLRGRIEAHAWAPEPAPEPTS